VLRRSLGLGENEFLVLLTGGAEGSGGIARRAKAILRWFADVDVIAVCGRNARLKRRLDRRAARSRGRLTVTGFTRNMPDLLRCCDLVVTKAGPGTIAEAACYGAPMLLTSHVPGQEAARPSSSRWRQPGGACRACVSSSPRSAGCATTRPPSKRCAPRPRG
jgi:1,2-diacylglycerol 3-beta-galactosyltransferase